MKMSCDQTVWSFECFPAFRSALSKTPLTFPDSPT